MVSKVMKDHSNHGAFGTELHQRNSHHSHWPFKQLPRAVRMTRRKWGDATVFLSASSLTQSGEESRREKNGKQPDVAVTIAP